MPLVGVAPPFATFLTGVTATLTTVVIGVAGWLLGPGYNVCVTGFQVKAPSVAQLKTLVYVLVSLAPFGNDQAIVYHHVSVRVDAMPAHTKRETGKSVCSREV